MVTFLLFAIVLCTLIFAGCRVNMYLYARGAFGVHSRAVDSVTIDGLPIQVAQRMAKRERDDGLYYARIGFLLTLGVAAILVVAAFSLFSSVFH